MSGPNREWNVGNSGPSNRPQREAEHRRSGITTDIHLNGHPLLPRGEWHGRPGAAVKLTSKGKKSGASNAYPMNDKKHARLAKSGASRAERIGNISKATEERIDSKANKVLGKR